MWEREGGVGPARHCRAQSQTLSSLILGALYDCARLGSLPAFGQRTLSASLRRKRNPKSRAEALRRRGTAGREARTDRNGPAKPLAPPVGLSLSLSRSLLNYLACAHEIQHRPLSLCLSSPIHSEAMRGATAASLSLSLHVSLSPSAQVGPAHEVGQLPDGDVPRQGLDAEVAVVRQQHHVADQAPRLTRLGFIFA